MKKEQLMDAIGELDEALIAEAMTDEHRPRRNFTALAAAAAVCAGIVIVAVPLTRWANLPGTGGVDPLTPGIDAPLTIGVEPPKIYESAGGIYPLIVDERAAVIHYEDGSYLIDNKTTEEITVAVRCPFYASYGNVMNLPEVLAETGPLSYSLELGKELAVPSEDGYNVEEIWDGAPDFMNKLHADGDEEVTVYVVSAIEPTAELASLKVEFSAEDAAIFTYGFQGWTHDDATGEYTLELRSRTSAKAYIIVRGELTPIEGRILPIKRTKNGFVAEMVESGGTMPLSEAIEMIVELDNASMAEERGDALYLYDAEHALYTQSVIDWLYDYAALSAEPQPRYHTGQLEIILADVRWAPRVFFLTFDLTLPAADSVKIWEEK